MYRSLKPSDVNRLDMQDHQGVVTRAKARQLKSHKDQIEQEKFQVLNFDVQDFTGQYAKVLNKLEIENSPRLYLSFGIKIWEGWNIPLWGLNLGLKFWGLNLVTKSLTFSSPFKGTFSLLLVTLILFIFSLTSWMKFYALEDHSTLFGIRATFKLVLTVVSMLLPQGAMDHSIASSTHGQKRRRLQESSYKESLIFREDLNGWIEKEEDESGEYVEDLRTNNFQEGEDDVNRLDMQEHQGVVTRAKAKQLKSHKDQIEQEKFQGLNFNVQDFMGQYVKVWNK
ncbi:hypothetical protein M9H77_17729 [Catharanthus roseus]|uniref:Uncharacterized protein n=1 Tax=Catharanthus roseus TaxID=4058 RepID=A0ACC0B5F1_CATRO|nr:hypothetical protein M9H77_17729 [Catharanthus roseus]